MNKVIAVCVLAMLSVSSVAFADNADKSSGVLEKVQKGEFKETWVNPNADLAKYSKVIIVPADFDFRDVRKGPRFSSLRHSNQREFWISKTDQERVIANITEEFDKELSKSSLEIVTEAGPEVLVLRAGFHDIVNHIPPTTAGSGNTFVSSVGAATMVVEALDSVTGDVLYRTSERSNVERPGTELFDSNRVQASVEVRRWARRLATRLVNAMEDVHG